MGKLIGAVIGFITLGFIGAIIGLIAGHFFDKGMRKLKNSESPEKLAAIQHTFFKTTFTLIGYLAKADGRVSEEEIDQTQRLMDKMGLGSESKREAIVFFKQGAAPEFDPDEILQEFREVCGRRVQLIQMLIIYLINTALADGKMDPQEDIALRKIAEGLNFSSAAFDQLMRMIYAQESFSHRQYDQGSSGPQASASDLANAYAALGVEETASDSEIKKAYRKLMSQYHPDKLMGQGVPEDMIKMATEQSQEVQRAYDLIKASRKK